MTTTNIMQGLVTEKPSSKVLNPPGGKSSNIFGGCDEPTEKSTQSTAISTQSTAISSVLGQGDDDAQQQANKNKCKAQESSQNRLFGGPDDDEDRPSGKGRDEEQVNEEERKARDDGIPEGGDEKQEATPEEKEENPEEKQELKKEGTPSPSRQKGRGSYNPITGEDYEGSPTGKGQATPNRVRQPPGGHSSGLW